MTVRPCEIVASPAPQPAVEEVSALDAVLGRWRFEIRRYRERADPGDVTIAQLLTQFAADVERAVPKGAGLVSSDEAAKVVGYTGRWLRGQRDCPRYKTSRRQNRYDPAEVLAWFRKTFSGTNHGAARVQLANGTRPADGRATARPQGSRA